MSSGSSRAVIANKMFELKSTIKQRFKEIVATKQLTEEQKAIYNQAVELYEKKKYSAANAKLDSLEQSSAE